jgi:hypothetical protein
MSSSSGPIMGRRISTLVSAVRLRAGQGHTAINLGIEQPSEAHGAENSSRVQRASNARQPHPAARQLGNAGINAFDMVCGRALLAIRRPSSAPSVPIGPRFCCICVGRPQAVEINSVQIILSPDNLSQMLSK